MTKKEQVQELKNAASFIALFEGSTRGIDKVISDLSGEQFNTPKKYSEKQPYQEGEIVIGKQDN